MSIAWVVLGFAACKPTTPGNPKPEAPVVVGLADFHSHMFAHLAFGGSLLTHDVDPTSACRAPIPADPGTFRLVDLVRDGLAHESLSQAKRGECSPTASNLSGQQMDVANLKRAVDYGLRLLVVHAVNSEFLCTAANMPGDCSDLTAIDAQLSAAHALEASLDTEAGGSGAGWFRIVTTPEQARSVIAQNKLAVVLGVEASNAFGGCRIEARGTVAAIPPPFVGTNLPENTYRLNCNVMPGPGGIEGRTNRAVALMEHFYDQGARHFFLVHNVPGVGGGNSLFVPMLHSVMNPVRRAPGSPSDRTADMNRLIMAARIPFTSFACPGASGFDGGRCNNEGLSWTGTQLARAIAGKGAIIDIDHLSLKAKRFLRSGDGIGPYPMVSSHAGFNQVNGGTAVSEHHLSLEETDDLIKWGGAVAPILNQGTAVGDVATFPAGATVVPSPCPGTSEAWVQMYRYAVARLSAGRLANGKPAFVGVGYGSDFDGLANWPRGRFAHRSLGGGGIDLADTIARAFVGSNLTPYGGGCYFVSSTAPAMVVYPFGSPKFGGSFGMSATPWSGRSGGYDINFEGVAHVGMIPDFVEELRVIGMTDADLEPLWHGAEAYIRAWETTTAWAGTYGDEKRRGISAKCQQARKGLVAFGGTVIETLILWTRAIDETKRLGCDFINESNP